MDISALIKLAFEKFLCIKNNFQLFSYENIIEDMKYIKNFRSEYNLGNTIDSPYGEIKLDMFSSDGEIRILKERFTYEQFCEMRKVFFCVSGSQNFEARNLLTCLSPLFWICIFITLKQYNQRVYQKLKDNGQRFETIKYICSNIPLSRYVYHYIQKEHI